VMFGTRKVINGRLCAQGQVEIVFQTPITARGGFFSPLIPALKRRG
jgi:hypothetical protein